MKNIFKLMGGLILSLFVGKSQASSVEKQHEQLSGLEKAKMVILKQFMYNEATFRNQALKFRRSTDEDRIGLGEVLSRIFEMNEQDVTSMGISSFNALNPNDVAYDVLTDKQAIWNFDVFSCVLKEKGESGHYKNASNYNSTLFLKTVNDNFVISIMGRGGAETEKYLRFSVMAMDDQYNNKAAAHSFLLAYSEPSDGSWLAKYDSIQESLFRKIKAKKMCDEVEVEILYGIDEFKENYYLGYGMWLLEQKRYYDAYTILMRAYNHHKQGYFTDAKSQEAYHIACSGLYSCLSQLGRYEEAKFFLKESNTDNENLSTLNKKIAEQSALVPQSDNAITVGYALDLLFGVKDKNVIADIAVYDFEKGSFEKVDRQTDSKLSDIVLNSMDARNKAFLVATSFAYYLTQDKEDSSQLCFVAPVVMVAHDVKDETGKLLTRVDAMASNFASNDDKQKSEPVNTPEHYTFIIGQDEVKSFDNSKESQDQMNAFCDDLFKSNRIMELYKLSQDNFQNRTVQVMNDGKMSKDEYIDFMADVCYAIGWSLMELGKLEKAEYYLLIAARSSGGYLREYINCLSNLHLPQALDIIDWAIDHTTKPVDAEYEDAWHFHMAFLKRRKAYVLIDQNRLEEAKALLEELLQDPLCHDFAESELNYLNHQK